MAKNNVIRPYASVIVVRILCWMAIVIGIGMVGFVAFTATVTDISGVFQMFGDSVMMKAGIVQIVVACIVLMLTNIVEDLKTLRVNEYGIQKKAQEFRNEVLTRMHNLEQENLHLIQEQQKLNERLEDFGEKSGVKTVRRSGRTGVRVSETPKDDETDYELDLH